MGETGTEGFELIDIKSQNIDGQTLDRLRDQFGSYEALFSKRALKFRAMGLHNKSLSDKDYRQLILDEYTFLKRPVYMIGDRAFVGNSKSTVADIKKALSE